MSLFVEVEGQGPDLVLLHGWGLHGGIFDAIAPQLAESFTLHRVDLPGHGRSPNQVGEYSLQTVAGAVLDSVPEQADWLGWSLGGRVAMQAALMASQRITKLISMAASPRFLAVEQEGWPGVAPEVLKGFAAGLETDYRKTLLQFLAIQAMGSARAKQEIRILREGLFAHGEPVLEALRGALGILQSADLREPLKNIQCPTLFLAGERDSLMPVQAAQLAAKKMANARVEVIAGAGHAPFISHPDQFLQITRQFLHE
ncbi:MAG: pimeloyl-ACP methyl ester esterase BioH [Gammaproteobacteria bacterium]|nr:pimeloyl-ACP methyl ester esterase BioH [Gammaproteobacteria bacterium]